MEIRIIIADDHRIIREGLKALIEKQPGMKVVGQAEDGIACRKLVAELKPDVVVMDIQMPNMNGIEATRYIVSEFPDIKIVALSIHLDRQFIAGMLKAGASGYLVKDCAAEELSNAILSVIAGRIYVSPSVSDLVIKDFMKSETGNDISAYSLLSAREREVLQLLAEGKSTKEIAFLLCVSVKTIENHRQNTMEKLGIYSVAELTKYAIREGLTTLER